MTRGVAARRIGRKAMEAGASSEPSASGTGSGSIVEQLTGVYLNEKFAPELLPHQEELIEQVKALVEEQGDMIAELDEQHALPRSLYEMEIERINYVLRGYLKCRLRKIERMCLHIESDADTRARLTEPEETFLRGYVELYQQHVDREVWDGIDGAGQEDAVPDSVRSVLKCPSLVIKPDLSANVFCRAERDCDPFTLTSDEARARRDLGAGPARDLCAPLA